MPVTTCSTRDLTDKVAELEAKGQRIQSVVPANDDTVIVVHYAARPVKETR